MKTMRPCLICHRELSNGKSIHTYEQGYKIEEYIVYFLGTEITGYLKSEDVTCNACFHMIYNIVGLKKQLKDAIIEDEDRSSECRFGLIWDAFHKEHSDNEADDTGNLLKASDAVDYDYISESILNKSGKEQRKSGFHSASNATNYSSSDTKSTQSDNKLKRRKKRRRSVAKKRRETRELSPAPSVCSSFSELAKIQHQERSRSVSVSRVTERVTPTVRRAKSSAKNTLPPLTLKLRSASEKEENVANQSTQFKCVLETCGSKFVTFLTLERLTDHRVRAHRMGLFYFCDECSSKFTCEKDLNLHIKLEHTNEDVLLVLNCLYCGERFLERKLLQQHYAEHLLHSVPCIYCYKDFLSKNDWMHHVELCHPPGDRKRIRKKKIQSTILKRCDFKCDSSSGSATPVKFIFEIMRLPSALLNEEVATVEIAG